MAGAALTKAVFYELNKKTGKPIATPNYPVMFNPADITVDTQVLIEPRAGTGDAAKPSNLGNDGKLKKTLKMKLHFDAVDVYEENLATRTEADLKGLRDLASQFGVKTANSTKFLGTQTSELDKDDLHILSPKYCSLSDLKALASHNNPVQFAWGKYGFKGYFTSFSVKYTYFAPDGTPLRAEVTISMATSPGVASSGGSDGDGSQLGPDGKRKGP